jgi:hypothetical protein
MHESPYAKMKATGGPLRIHKTPGYKMHGNRVVGFNPLVYRPGIDLFQIQAAQNKIKRNLLIDYAVLPDA